MTYVQAIACTAGLVALFIFIYWRLSRNPKEPTAYTSELNDIRYYRQEGTMIKEYKKIKKIKAEQFDGSEEMINKYKLEKDISDGTDWYVITTLEGELYFRKGAWIATGVNGEHWAIADDIFRETYEEV